MEEWHVRVYGLVFNCPLDENNLQCPFYDIRQLPVRERLKMIEELPLDDLFHMASKHFTCISGKEKANYYTLKSS